MNKIRTVVVDDDPFVRMSLQEEAAKRPSISTSANARTCC